MKRFSLVVIGLFFCAHSLLSEAVITTSTPQVVQPGSSTETLFLEKSKGATLSQQGRVVPLGAYLLYGFPTSAGAIVKIGFTFATDSSWPHIAVVDMHNKPLTFQFLHQSESSGLLTCQIPAAWPFGKKLKVLLGAKEGPFILQQITLVQEPIRDPNTLLPLGVLHWLQADTQASLTLNHSAASFLWALPNSGLQPLPISQIPFGDILLPTSLLQATSMANWKTWGHNVFASFSLAPNSDYIRLHPDALQRWPNGSPIQLHGQPLLEPSPQNGDAINPALTSLASLPLDGILFPALPYLLDAEPSSAFKQAWQNQYASPWSPSETPDNRYAASELRANLDANFNADLLKKVQSQLNPKHIVLALPDPFTALIEREIVPWWQILHKSSYNNELAKSLEVTTPIQLNTLQHPVLLAGDNRADPFYNAYLLYSWLGELTRGLNASTLTPFLLAAPNQLVSAQQAKTLFEQQVIAAFLAMPSNRFYLDASLLTLPLLDSLSPEIWNVLALFNQIAGSPPNIENGSSIGILLGDSITYQANNEKALEDIYALTLPLISQGIPCKLLSLERSVDPGYLSPYKVLVLTCDPQKPMGAATLDALANWVRNGGVLVLVGGSNSYNTATRTWWHQAHFVSPIDYLWNHLGIPVGLPTVVSPPQENPNSLTVLSSSSENAPRMAHRIVLTPFVSSQGSVLIQFSHATSLPDVPAIVHSVEIRVGGKIVAAFLTGTEVENYFLVYNHQSDIVPKGRTILQNGSWTYQFDHLPQNQTVELLLDCEGPLQIAAGPSTPDYARGLLSASQEGDLSRFFPRFHPPYDCTLTTYSLSKGTQQINGIQPLYVLRNGTSPIWLTHVGNGLVLQIGLSPHYFAANQLSANLYRALLDIAVHHTRLSLTEHGYLVARYGAYYAIRTLDEAYTLPGPSVDIFSPTLQVQQDRVLPPHSAALLMSFSPSSLPTLLFANGFVQAQITAPHLCAYFVKGPPSSKGITRLFMGSHALLGAKAVDSNGAPVPLQTSQEGTTVLLEYPNDPNGVAIQVRWK